ncbi:MAG: S16 family serine protease [Anaerolineae bacterium]
MKERHIFLQVGQARLSLGASWLALIPLVMWLIATLYVPVMAPTLSTREAWGLAVAITLLVMASLTTHALAHAAAARVAGHRDNAPAMPASIPIYAFGDAAHVWPPAATPWREALVALAGAAANLLLAGMTYLIWNRQLHPYLNASSIFVAAFNVGLAIVNLAPGFPLDGGRLTRAIGWGLLNRPARATLLGLWLGRLMTAALAGWAVILISQRARFSLETGASTLAAAGVLGLALWQQPAREWDRPAQSQAATLRGSGVRGAIAGLLILGLLGIAGSLAPTNHGLEAPGLALSVEPMIELPPEYRHPYTGSFLLTTVFPQAPITAGQWVYGQLSPVVKIVPPERIVPPDKTPQELAQEGNRMLDESRTLATVVALRMAGYDVQVLGEAAEVVSILPESPAHDVLQPGDHIVALNDGPIRTASALAEMIRAQDPNANISLLVERDDEQMQFTLPLMQPSSADEPPRLGIGVQTAGFDVDIPFPVKVEPQKIAGGPSAGLMFTLTIYNLLTPEDLTGGRRIAGTGTINLDGQVGPIGGVEQKVAGAEGAGAEYFLSPHENYKDARRVARRIKVVEVATAEEAIEFLRGLPAPVDQ